MRTPGLSLLFVKFLMTTKTGKSDLFALDSINQEKIPRQNMAFPVRFPFAFELVISILRWKAETSDKQAENLVDLRNLVASRGLEFFVIALEFGGMYRAVRHGRALGLQLLEEIVNILAYDSFAAVERSHCLARFAVWNVAGVKGPGLSRRLHNLSHTAIITHRLTFVNFATISIFVQLFTFSACPRSTCSAGSSSVTLIEACPRRSRNHTSPRPACLCGKCERALRGGP